MEALVVKPEEAARMMGVSRSTVYGLMARGELASLTIGRSRRITPEAIRTFLSSCPSTPPSKSVKAS